MSSITAVVPAYGRPELLDKCLANLGDIPKLVVDDCTPKERGADEVKAVSLRYGVKFYRNTSNLGFPATVNFAMRKVKTTYALLINTDVVLFEGALDVLNEEMSDDSVGIAAPMLLFAEGTPFGPAGKIQHVGMAISVWGNPIHLFIGWSAGNPRAAQRRFVNAVTGACFLVRRSVWNKVGGFDLSYGRGTYEDIEFCIRARIAGYKIVVNPKAVGTHAVGQSSAALREGFDLNQNAQIFQLRMQGTLVNDDYLYW